MLPRTLTHELWNPIDYVLAVQHVVESLEADGHASFLETCRRSRGAFPTLVAQFSKAPVVDSRSHYDSRKPYPSPARGEWYFTRDTAQMLARRLGTSPLLIGTPSIAEIAVNATLIDPSPWIFERFALNRSTRVVNRPVEELAILPTCEAAIIDPPWYGAVIEDWLARASHAVTQGGSILVPLMGELTRPNAAADRAAVTAAMESIGSVTVLQGIIEYATPLFEERALATAGIRLGRPWRIADLAIVRNEVSAKEPPCRYDAPEWTDYRVGDDIISVRSPVDIHRSETILAYPSSRIDDLLTLDSVSRRHPLVPHANLWSSKNRIGRVEDLRAVRRALALLANRPNICIEMPDSTLAARLREAFIEEAVC